MNHVIIRRCPLCPTIGAHARGIAATVGDELGLYPEVADGDMGEFTVVVGGHEVYRKSGDELPSAEQVIMAVRHEVAAGFA
jgi:hypothetical protein